MLNGYPLPGLMNECPTKPFFDYRNIPFLFHGRYGLEYLVKFWRQITALFCARLQIWHSSTLTARNKNGINFQPLLEHSFISPPFASALYDRVVSICSLEHFTNDGWALLEMARILKPGGIAVLTVDSLSHPHGLSGQMLEQYRSKHSIRHCYRLEDIQRMAADSGFEVEGSRYLVNSWFSSYLHRLWARWNLRGVHPNRLEVLFPEVYPLALVSDLLFGSFNAGAILAVKLRRAPSGI